MVAGLKKTRANPICPFLFHLYKHHDCLKEEEEGLYEVAMVTEEFGIEREDRESDSDSDTPEATPITPSTSRKKRKQTNRVFGTPPSRKRESPEREHVEQR